MAWIVSPPFQDNSYQTILRDAGKGAREVFIDLTIPVAQRYLRQTRIFPQYTDQLQKLIGTIWDIVHLNPLPQPLNNREVGEAKDADEGLIQGLMGKIENQNGGPLPEPLQIFSFQILVTLTQPEFKTCRMSFTEKDAEGCISRQDRSYCADRISGSHCEDCPYFTALSQEKHEKFLSKLWAGDTSRLQEQLALFLPADFRFLRIFWYLHLRNQNTQ